MERDNYYTQGKMKKRVEETPDFTLSTHVYEELSPDARLNNVRYSYNEEADNGKSGNR
jgi:hypothetical protein